jgi:U3 small nucleolar RNA-associated protein 6
MGDSVERSLEETVPLLRQIRRFKLMTENEVMTLVQHRRDHEYALLRSDAPRASFLRYAAFERDLADLLQARAEARNLPNKRTRNITNQQSARVNLVYSRAIRRFKGDDALYLHYAKHCIESGSRKAAEKVLARAIAHRGDSERVWLAAAAFHFDSCGDVKVARAISQRGLRALRHSKVLWKEYFRLELAYLAKLIARRTTIGTAAAAQDPRRLGDEAAAVATSLCFWDGGIPLATFRSALEAANLSALDAIEYARIACDMQFTPAALLSMLASTLQEHFGETESAALRAVSICNPYDVASARLHQKRADAQAAVTTKVSPTDAADVVVGDISPEFESAVLELLAVALKTATDVVAEFELLAKSVSSSDPERPTAIAIFEKCAEAMAEDMANLGMDKTEAVVATATAVGLLLARCDNVLSSAEGTWKTPSNGTASGDSMSLEALRASNSPKLWSEYLAGYGMTVAEADADSAKTLIEIRVGLLAAVSGPFRTSEQRDICLVWFEWERNLDELRKAYDFVLSLPPSDLRLVRAAIAAELRLAGIISRTASKTNPVIQRIRALYLKGTNLTSAISDVDFWLSYAQFERDIARDARRAADVQWTASRTLPKELKTDLQERCTLLNLC